MYEINGKLWDTEKDIRNDVDMPLKEVGRLALKVRDLNCKRNEIKGEVVDIFAEGFKEIKINYKKIDYGKKWGQLSKKWEAYHLANCFELVPFKLS